MQHGKLEHILGQVPVLGLQAYDLGEWLKELVAGVNDEFKVPLLDDICLLLKNLICRILIGATVDELPQLGYLVGLLELRSDEKGTHSNQLQLI